MREDLRDVATVDGVGVFPFEESTRRKHAERPFEMLLHEQQRFLKHAQRREQQPPVDARMATILLWGTLKRVLHALEMATEFGFLATQFPTHAVVHAANGAQYTHEQRFR